LIYMMLINISSIQDAKTATTTVALLLMFAAMSTIAGQGVKGQRWSKVPVKGSPFNQPEESVEPIDENSKNSTSVSNARNTYWRESPTNKSIVKLVRSKQDTKQKSLEDSIENEPKIELKNKKLWRQDNDKAIGSKELGSGDNEDGQVPEYQYYDNEIENESTSIKNIESKSKEEEKTNSDDRSPQFEKSHETNEAGDSQQTDNGTENESRSIKDKESKSRDYSEEKGIWKPPNVKQIIVHHLLVPNGRKIQFGTWIPRNRFLPIIQPPGLSRNGKGRVLLVGPWRQLNTKNKNKKKLDSKTKGN